MLILLVVVLAMLGSATKLQTSRKIELDGAVKGEVDFDGSKNVTIKTTQENIKEVTTTLTLANGKASGNINYPSGYTKDNCYVLSFMARKTDLSSNDGYGYGYIESTQGYIKGAIGHSVELTNSNIEINISNPADSSNGNATFAIKILLMKTN